MAPAEEEQAIETTVEESTNKDEGTDKVEVGVGKFKASVKSNQMPFLGQFFASIILIIAMTSGTYGEGTINYAYAISLGAISMFFNLFGCFLTGRKEMADKKLFSLPFCGEMTMMCLLNTFLFIWWFVGAFVLTFNGPFKTTGNGYFASWGGFAFSLMGMGVNKSTIDDAKAGGGSLLGLWVAALVVLCATPSQLDGAWRSEVLYALILAVLTMVVYGVVLHVKAMGKMSTHLERGVFVSLAIFAIMWFVMACLVTFRGPFLETGNGYFGAWGGAFTCIYAAAQHMEHGCADEAGEEEDKKKEVEEEKPQDEEVGEEKPQDEAEQA